MTTNQFFLLTPFYSYLGMYRTYQMFVNTYQNIISHFSSCVGLCVCACKRKCVCVNLCACLYLFASFTRLRLVIKYTAKQTIFCSRFPPFIFFFFVMGERVHSSFSHEKLCQNKIVFLMRDARLIIKLIAVSAGRASTLLFKTFKHKYILTSTHIYIYICISLSLSLYIYIYECMRECVCMHVHGHMHANIPTCTHIYGVRQFSGENFQWIYFSNLLMDHLYILMDQHYILIGHPYILMD